MVYAVDIAVVLHLVHVKFKNLSNADLIPIAKVKEHVALYPGNAQVRVAANLSHSVIFRRERVEDAPIQKNVLAREYAMSIREFALGRASAEILLIDRKMITIA